MKLVLASSSPRRARLLEQIGLNFERIAPEVDESRYPDEDPFLYVERVARAKAAAIATPDRVVVAGDTAVIHEGRIMGKPVHPEEARAMLRSLQGTSHEVMTGLAVATHGADVGLTIRSLVDSAVVEMLIMTEDEIGGYVNTGEPLDKAGAYALQGIGGRFVKSVSGSPSTVVGLPIHLLSRLFSGVGLDLSAFLADAPG